MLKTIVFDFDYTLGDSSEGIVQSVNHALCKMGYPPQTPETIFPLIGLSLPETFRRLTGCAERAAAKTFTRLFHEKAESVMAASARLYPHALPLLRMLRTEGLKTAIVTTKLRRRVNEILARFDAEDCFDLVVGAEDVRAEKPSPEGILFAAEQLAADKDCMLYVGDSLVDAQAACHAGVRFAAVLTGKTDAAAFAPYHPAAVARDLSALEQKIRRMIA